MHDVSRENEYCANLLNVAEWQSDELDFGSEGVEGSHAVMQHCLITRRFAPIFHFYFLDYLYDDLGLFDSAIMAL
ncbi:hypothetical protein C2S51_018303 [Perilla frutescens var. frutescens]|nr:hypothetical protein C2S51_018303 [Perilla frutescens var. frutescens]